MFSYEINILCDNPNCRGRGVVCTEPLPKCDQGKVVKLALSKGWKIIYNSDNTFKAYCAECAKIMR